MESPDLTCWMGWPFSCTRQVPARTCSAWPIGWVCHAVRALGSKVTHTALKDAGGAAFITSSNQTAPVNQASGPSRQVRIDSVNIFIVARFYPTIALPKLEDEDYSLIAELGAASADCLHYAGGPVVALVDWQRISCPHPLQQYP